MVKSLKDKLLSSEPLKNATQVVAKYYHRSDFYQPHDSTHKITKARKELAYQINKVISIRSLDILGDDGDIIESTVNSMIKKHLD